MAVVFEKPKALTDAVFHYCPGCTHGIIHRLVAEAIDALGIEGKTKGEKFMNFLAAIRALQRRIGIKPTIRDYVPDEKDFLDRLDAMVEQAFDDQCTGANPRYPLMGEIKQMYLNAYYGNNSEAV